MILAAALFIFKIRSLQWSVKRINAISAINKLSAIDMKNVHIPHMYKRTYVYFLSKHFDLLMAFVSGNKIVKLMNDILFMKNMRNAWKLLLSAKSNLAKIKVDMQKFQGTFVYCKNVI